jgi:hypothetical protein
MLTDLRGLEILDHGVEARPKIAEIKEILRHAQEVDNYFGVFILRYVSNLILTKIEDKDVREAILGGGELGECLKHYDALITTYASEASEREK